MDDEYLSEEEEEIPKADLDLLEAVTRNDATAVQQAFRNGANGNSYSDAYSATPLMEACRLGYDEIVQIILDAGADGWCWDSKNRSTMEEACANGHLSTVEILLSHNKYLLEIEGSCDMTPLLVAIKKRKFEIVRFLLDRGANALATNDEKVTALMLACSHWANLEIVRLLLAAGVPVEARDIERRTALFYAATSSRTDVIRELVVEHYANIMAVDDNGKTPFDSAMLSFSADRISSFLIECYGNILTQQHGRLALPAVLRAAEYSFAEDDEFHPPLSHLRISLSLGDLTLQHFRALLHSLDIESIRNRDGEGKLPIHIACHDGAPVEVLAMIAELDPATLQIADHSGALPIHLLFCRGFSSIEYASVRYLVEQGGVGTLAARNRDGAMPLHVLCGSTIDPLLRIVQYLIQSFPGSVAAQTSSGQYPFMIAASEPSWTSLSVVYELVRTIPRLVIPSN